MSHQRAGMSERGPRGARRAQDQLDALSHRKATRATELDNQQLAEIQILADACSRVFQEPPDSWLGYVVRAALEFPLDTPTPTALSEPLAEKAGRSAASLLAQLRYHSIYGRWH